MNFTVKAQQEPESVNMNSKRQRWFETNPVKYGAFLPCFDICRTVLSSSSRATLVREDLAHLQLRLLQITAMAISAVVFLALDLV